jgi:hypothetical protein
VIGGNDKDMPCMNWRMADIVYSCSAQVGWLAKERVVFRFKVRWLVSAGAVWFHFLTIAASAGAPQLVMPLACEVGRSCAIQQYVDHDASSGDRDYRCGTLTYNGHNGTDFRLPTTAIQRAGIDVLAAAARYCARATACPMRYWQHPPIHPLTVMHAAMASSYRMAMDGRLNIAI